MRQPPSLGHVPGAIQRIADLTINLASIKEMHIAVLKATNELGVWTWPYQASGHKLLALAIVERIATLAGDPYEHPVRAAACPHPHPASSPAHADVAGDEDEPVPPRAVSRNKRRVRTK
jgi:hypothetical protein